MGSRVPEPNGARQVFTPAFNITTMAEKSEQEKRIDGIINACEEMQNCVSEMDFRLSFYRLIEKIIVVTEEVEHYINLSKKQLLIGIDRGFRYAAKAKLLENLHTVLSKPRSLKLKIEERNTKLLVSDDVISEDYIKESTKRYIPYDKDDNMERINEDDYMDVYKKAGKRNLFSPSHMQLFVRNALNGLMERMRELDEILDKGDKTKYPALYEANFGDNILRYTIGSLKSDFEKWREDHDATAEDDKWKKKLTDHIYVCMADLFKSEFLLYYDNTLTEEDKDKLRQDCLAIKCISNDAELYLNLIDMVNIKIDKNGLKYKPSEIKIGRYLYRHRNQIDLEAINAFKVFLANLYLHQDALNVKPKKKNVDYDVVKYQFKKLLTESKWIDNFVADGYNENYFDQFVDNLMDSEFKDQIASSWEKPASREKMKGHLLGSLLNAGVLTGMASEIARKYIGKKNKDAENFADYISEGKNKSKCKYSDWVYYYVNG